MLMIWMFGEVQRRGRGSAIEVLAADMKLCSCCGAAEVLTSSCLGRRYCGCFLYTLTASHEAHACITFSTSIW